MCVCACDAATRKGGSNAIAVTAPRLSREGCIQRRWRRRRRWGTTIYEGRDDAVYIGIYSVAEWPFSEDEEEEEAAAFCACVFRRPAAAAAALCFSGMSSIMSFQDSCEFHERTYTRRTASACLLYTHIYYIRAADCRRFLSGVWCIVGAFLASYKTAEISYGYI